MKRSKATHYGCCQICGARQKLPGDRLAQHGYAIQFGHFHGVCHGSREAPFELDCSVALASVAKAVRLAELNRAEAQAHLKGERPLSIVDTKGREWVVESLKKSPDKVWGWEAMVDWELAASLHAPCPIEIYALYGDHLKAIERQLRVERAAHCTRAATDYERYVSWQRRRLTGWRQRALVPTLANPIGLSVSRLAG